MKRNYILLTILFIAIVNTICYSQVLPPPPPLPSTGVPFGAAEYLLAGLGIYAYKKFKNSKK